MITKQDFETYLDIMIEYYKVNRSELLVSAYKVLPEGDIYDFFEDSKIISVLDTGIIVMREFLEEEDDEDEDEESGEEERQFKSSDLVEPVFVPWSSIDEIVISKTEEQED